MKISHILWIKGREAPAEKRVRNQGEESMWRST
jgi:hypothetical protein